MRHRAKAACASPTAAWRKRHGLCQLQLNLTRRQKEAIHAAAIQEGLSLSQFVRLYAGRAAREILGET